MLIPIRFLLIIINFCCHSVFAITYLLPNDNSRLIGKNLKFIIPPNNIHSLEYFSEKFQVGLRNVLRANPDIDLYLPNSKKEIIIPHKLILPDTIHSGIIINSAEMRLYYYPENDKKHVIILPIAIGTITHPTPSNWITSIKHKKKPYLGTYK